VGRPALLFALEVYHLAAKKKGGIAQQVRSFVEPYARELGLTVWDVRYLKEGANWFLRIFIDKKGGVSIDDCVDLTHAINDPLDELDPVSEAYTLEVCSPGIDRELTRPEHFAAYLGEPVRVRLFHALPSGERELSGILKNFEEENVTLQLSDDTDFIFSKKDASWVKLDDDAIGGN
jgi:ribosome maturation factor RimP